MINKIVPIGKLDFKKNQKKISQKQEPARMYLQKTCIQRRRELSRPDKVFAWFRKKLSSINFHRRKENLWNFWF